MIDTAPPEGEDFVIEHQGKLSGKAGFHRYPDIGFIFHLNWGHGFAWEARIMERRAKAATVLLGGRSLDQRSEDHVPVILKDGPVAPVDYRIGLGKANAHRRVDPSPTMDP